MTLARVDQVSDPPMPPLTLPFADISADCLPRVGGKGANLGELARLGLPVPPGFCITTVAFDAFVAGCPTITSLYDRLDALDGKDAAAARAVAEEVRDALSRVPIPSAVADAVLATWTPLDAAASWAVRSSATAEDLPGASFAGQQDTFLHVRGAAALLDAVRRCWVSLFSDRAVLYRARSGFGHRDVKLAVVVQRMVLPEVAGILFTADPVSGHRGLLSIEAAFGLGEALVGGRINGDLYRVNKATGAPVAVQIGDKALAQVPRPEGGTAEVPLPDAQRCARTLSDAVLRELAELGIRIERHYGCPQDIEWCLADGTVSIVQARPITSLYPLPEPAPEDAGLHVYVSFGHVQMMTDPMPPLARQVWQLLLPGGRPHPPSRSTASGESRFVTAAGGRIYLDLTPLLRHPILVRVVPALFTRVYPDVGAGLRDLAARVRARPSSDGGRVRFQTLRRVVLPVLRRVLVRFVFADPRRLRADAERHGEVELASFRAELAAASSAAARLHIARTRLSELFTRLFLVVAASVPAGLLAHTLLRRWVGRGWLGGTLEDVAALERGLPGNVTTEMDLAVGDLIDRLHACPSLLERLRTLPAREALRGVEDLPGGAAFVTDFTTFLARYGMRGPSEVDISRPRYQDDPTPLLATLLGSDGSKRVPGEHRARHVALRAEAEAASARLIAASRRGAMGWVRGAVTQRLIAVGRTGMGLREHPKFLLVRMLELVREAVREAACELVARGSLGHPSDAYMFRFEELIAALQAKVAPDLHLLAASRRTELEGDRQRTPPLLMTSEGEIPAPPHRDDVPPGALSGTAASAGVMEGRARVVLDPSVDILLDGEVLVAPHTDPGWTPLFVHAAALVTEVGGLITHGSVVAREYGIPAVVSVARATTRIRTGQRIRVDGTRGLVEILDEDTP